MNNNAKIVVPLSRLYYFFSLFFSNITCSIQSYKIWIWIVANKRVNLVYPHGTPQKSGYVMPSNEYYYLYITVYLRLSQPKKRSLMLHNVNIMSLRCISAVVLDQIYIMIDRATQRPWPFKKKHLIVWLILGMTKFTP